MIILIGSLVLLALVMAYLSVLAASLLRQDRRDRKATQDRRLPGAFRDR